jgi:hypothetical protein
MPSQVKTRVALVGGAVMVALAAGVGGGVLLSDTTTPTRIATPTSSVPSTSPPTAAPGAPTISPSTGNFNSLGGGDTGCVHHVNC